MRRKLLRFTPELCAVVHIQCTEEAEEEGSERE